MRFFIKIILGSLLPDWCHLSFVYRALRDPDRTMKICGAARSGRWAA